MKIPCCPAIALLCIALFLDPRSLLHPLHIRDETTSMSQSSQLQILSDLIRAATGISNHADLEQIDRIATLMNDNSQVENISKNLVIRLEKPLLYGLLCVDKTLYLIEKLLPISHQTFREFCISNCEIFDRIYLQDVSDNDEVQTCKNIRNIQNDIKKMLKQLIYGLNLEDTMPPVYHSIAPPENCDHGSLSSPDTSSTAGTNSRQQQSSRNQISNRRVSPNPLNDISQTLPQRASLNHTPSPTKTDTTLAESAEKAPNVGTPTCVNASTPSQNDSTGIITPQPSPRTVQNRSLLKNFLSPASSLCTLSPPQSQVYGELEAIIEAYCHTPEEVSGDDSTVIPTRCCSPTSPSNPTPQISLTRSSYVPMKSVQIQDDPEIIDSDSDIISETSTVKPSGKERIRLKTKTKYKEAKRTQEAYYWQRGNTEESSSGSVVLTAERDGVPKIPLFAGQVLDVTDCIQTTGLHPFAKGGHAHVWKGIYTWEDRKEIVAIKKLNHDHQGNKNINVAIKKILANHDHQGNENIKNLFNTWKKLLHENIVPFYGIYKFSENIYGMAFPFYTNGHVIQYLKKTKADPIKLIYEIAKGIEYLHSNGVIHGDLKGTNVLIDYYGHARITDFGLAQIYDEETLALGEIAPNTRTSIRWSAPELLRPVSRSRISKTEKSDIYSFACTAVEMMTLKVPYSHINGPSSLIRTICSGECLERPRAPYDPHDDLWSLFYSCLNGIAEKRPTISQLIFDLKSYVPYY